MSHTHLLPWESHYTRKSLPPCVSLLPGGTGQTRGSLYVCSEKSTVTHTHTDTTCFQSEERQKELNFVLFTHAVRQPLQFRFNSLFLGGSMGVMNCVQYAVEHLGLFYKGDVVR